MPLPFPPAHSREEPTLSPPQAAMTHLEMTRTSCREARDRWLGVLVAFMRLWQNIYSHCREGPLPRAPRFWRGVRASRIFGFEAPHGPEPGAWFLASTAGLPDSVGPPAHSHLCLPPVRSWWPPPSTKPALIIPVPVGTTNCLGELLGCGCM